MADAKRYFLTTAIDYPNSRPHIGTAFEKIGADVQARYRRMEGYDVFFLMGNDENTVKVAKRAAELGQRPQGLLRRHGPAVPGGLATPWTSAYDDFIQTSEPRHHAGLPEVHPEGVRQRLHLQGQLRGLVLRGLRGVQDREGAQGSRRHLSRSTRRRRSAAASRATSSPCRSSRIGCWSSTRRTRTSSSRRAGATRSLSLVQSGLAGRQHHPLRPDLGHPRAVRRGVHDLRLVRRPAELHHRHRLRRPTRRVSSKWWPADIHFIGKDITRFHCALWPAMLLRRRDRAAARCSATASSTSRTRRPASEKISKIARQRRRADGHHHASSAPRRSATTSCASARSPATASSAGSASRTCTTPTWRTTSATSTAGW